MRTLSNTVPEYIRMAHPYGYSSSLHIKLYPYILSLSCPSFILLVTSKLNPFNIFEYNIALYSSPFVNFVNSGLTVQSSSYACCVSAVNSKVTVSSSRIAAVSQTCVNFSLSGGSFELKDSSCRVTAHLGRIAEISSSTIKMSGNTFYGEFDKKIRGVEPVWKDNQCLIIEESGNSSQGF